MPIATSALAALAVGSAASQYFGSRSAAAGVKQQGAYEASILEQNAGFADTQATDAIARGKTEEQRHQLAVRQLIGSERTNIAAQGIALDSGSAADIQKESATMGALDELTIRNNAAREAYGYKVQAADYRNRAQLTRLGAKNQAQGIKNQGYSTLLTGAANVAGLYRK